MEYEASDLVRLVEGQYGTADVDLLRTANPGCREYDLLAAQLEELSYTRFIEPSLLTPVDPVTRGDWIYLSWSRTLCHLVTHQEFDELRTNRNRDLITASEQRSLLSLDIAIAGLSIGANILVGLCRSAIGSRYRIADFDKIETTNLNRAPYPFWSIGATKIDHARHAALEVNPFAIVVPFSEGVSEQNIADFCDGADVIFDEIDDFKVKLLLRYQARRRGIPVLMLTNLGDNLLVDVERYDRDEAVAPFNGRVPGLEDLEDFRRLPRAEQDALAVRIVGIENVPTRALQSLPQIGHTLVGRPQVASTIGVASGIASLVVRELFLRGDALSSGRYRVSLRGLLGLIEDDRLDERPSVLSDLKRESGQS